jgi:hypothetical protein
MMRSLPDTKARVLEYARAYMVPLAMAPKLSYTKFLRGFNTACSSEDYRIMAFVLEEELITAADSAPDAVLAVWSLVGHQWRFLALALTVDYVLGVSTCVETAMFGPS